MKESIGSLKYLYLEELEIKESCTAHPFLISAAAQELASTDGHNYVPIIVKELKSDTYVVIGNSFIYEVTKEAGIERVWCIVTDGDKETQAITKLLAGERLPKTNLSIASRDEIVQALDYAINIPGSPLKGLKKPQVITKIDDAPTRKYWKTLDEIAKLKCGITRGKKLNALKDIFFLTPDPLPEVIKDPGILMAMTSTELKKRAKKRGFTGYSKYKKAELVKLLSQ